MRTMVGQQHGTFFEIWPFGNLVAVLFGRSNQLIATNYLLKSANAHKFSIKRVGNIDKVKRKFWGVKNRIF